MEPVLLLYIEYVEHDHHSASMTRKIFIFILATHIVTWQNCLFITIQQYLIPYWNEWNKKKYIYNQSYDMGPQVFVAIDLLQLPKTMKQIQIYC